MKLQAFVFSTLVLLGGCAEIVDENVTEAFVEDGFYQGERYFVRTRTMQGANGTFEVTNVVYKGFARQCILTSPGDCETAGRRLIEDVDESFFPA